MHAPIFIDPRIRDYVFVPLVFLMFTLQILRIMAMRYMNEPKNKMLERAHVAYASLFGTLFEKDADRERRLPEGQMDVCKIIEEGTETDIKEMQALTRSKTLRKKADWLPEKAVQNRKAYFCQEKTGYLHREIETANAMNMMQNPDMMNNMLKQNLQSVIHIVMFTGIGSVFQGFITAQVPFPLGHKFK